jgi:hypothetical protein
MPTSFAVHHKCFPMAAEVVISLVLVVLMALTFRPGCRHKGQRSPQSAARCIELTEPPHRVRY